MPKVRVFTFCLLAASLFPLTIGAQWVGFRGQSGSGVYDVRDAPIHFGPDTGVVWKQKVPEGKSSPVLAGNRIFLTGHDGDKLLTLCLSQETGDLLWRREIPRTVNEGTPIIVALPRSEPAEALRSLAADFVCLSSGVRPTKLKASTAVETLPYGVSLAIGLAAGVAAALVKEVP